MSMSNVRSYRTVTPPAFAVTIPAFPAPAPSTAQLLADATELALSAVRRSARMRASVSCPYSVICRTGIGE